MSKLETKRGKSWVQKFYKNQRIRLIGKMRLSNQIWKNPKKSRNLLRIIWIKLMRIRAGPLINFMITANKKSQWLCQMK